MRPLVKLLGKLLTSDARKFRHALKNPQAAQQSVRDDLLRRLAASEYGKFLGIAAESSASVDRIWNQIPIVEYDDIKHWIVGEEDMGDPRSLASISREKNSPITPSLLTPEPILFYEKTSGSRGTAKWIPYTKSLRQSFNHMFCVWAHDLIEHGPRFSTGQIYFCISPQLGKSAPHSPVGLENDSEYLDGWLRWFLRPFLVSPAGLNRLQEAEEFKHRLCMALLEAEKLEIISIWSPSFLKVELDYIENHRQQLLEKLGNRISGDRAQYLLEPEIPWTKIWPDLKLISCWDRVHAADSANTLRSLFPGVRVQGKGLLATEAPMTIPIIDAGGFVPVLDEVFFEFEDDRGKIYLLHEIEAGAAYSIVVSQKGGLYRYRIGDRVRVTHFYWGTPCLEFLGRTHAICDLVGEKLHEVFVGDILDNLNLKTTFFKTLVSATTPREHYVLLLDKAEWPAAEIAKRLDEGLMRSPHYRQARLLGQLDRPQVLVSPLIPELVTLYRTKSGKKWGDLKHEILAISPIEADLLAELHKVCHVG